MSINEMVTRPGIRLDWDDRAHQNGDARLAWELTLRAFLQHF